MSLTCRDAGSPKMPPGSRRDDEDSDADERSIWVAKSVRGGRVRRVQTASAKQSMGRAMRAIPGCLQRLDRLMSRSPRGRLPYLTEMTMVIEGGGEMAAMMKQFAR